MSKRIALVSGGMGGIGTAICKALAEAGHTVVTTYSRPGKEGAWLSDMKGLGFDVHAVQCDVTDFDACQAAVAKIQAEIGPIDVLVNNAGITRDASFRKLGKADWDAVISTNLDSLFNLCKPVVDGMTERGFGRVINISSINGQKGQFGCASMGQAECLQGGGVGQLAVGIQVVQRGMGGGMAAGVQRGGNFADTGGGFRQ